MTDSLNSVVADSLSNIFGRGSRRNGRQRAVAQAPGKAQDAAVPSYANAYSRCADDGVDEKSIVEIPKEIFHYMLLNTLYTVMKEYLFMHPT